MKKIKVAVLMGGRTPEHEISLISGREVVRNLPSKYQSIPILISRDGSNWSYVSKERLLSAADPLKLKGTNKELINTGTKAIISTKDLIDGEVNVAFIAMHGPYGEDGTIQGMLELAGFSYTGSGVLASALGMDKLMFKSILSAKKIAVPRHVVARKGDSLNRVAEKLGGPPYFVKPHNQGSSVGMSLVRKKNELASAVNKARKYSNIVLIEEYIKGKEITCGVLGNDKPYALPLVEIKPIKGEFFNYESKYFEGGAEETVPARISKHLTKKTQETAIRVYKIIGCRGLARVDFILRGGKDPVCLEINTIPGLTPMSLMPKAARAANISYSELLERIIKYANE